MNFELEALRAQAEIDLADTFKKTQEISVKNTKKVLAAFGLTADGVAEAVRKAIGLKK